MFQYCVVVLLELCMYYDEYVCVVIHVLAEKNVIGAAPERGKVKLDEKT